MGKKDSTTDSSSTPAKARPLHVYITIGVLLGILLAILVRAWFAYYYLPPKVQFHLNTAKEQTKDAAAQAEEELHEFFDVARENSRRFAEDVLGLYSKWYVTVDALPFTRNDRLKEYITQCFNDDIFSPEDLEQELQNILERYLQEVESIENEMLVNIQQDVPDLPPNSLIQTTPPENLKDIFQTILEQTAQSSQCDLVCCIGRETVSAVASGILGKLAVQMAVSSGIFGAAGPSAPVTCGLSIVAAFLIDGAISWIWDWYTDPKGKVCDAICAQIDNIENLIIQGDDKAQGLRAQLQNIGQERAKLRKKTIRKMIHSTTEGSTL